MLTCCKGLRKGYVSRVLGVYSSHSPWILIVLSSESMISELGLQSLTSTYIQRDWLVRRSVLIWVERTWKSTNIISLGARNPVTFLGLSYSESDNIDFMLSSSKIESSTRVFEVRLIRPLDERLFLDFDLRAEAARDVKSLVVLSWDLLVGVALTSFIGDECIRVVG